MDAWSGHVALFRCQPPAGLPGQVGKGGSKDSWGPMPVVTLLMMAECVCFCRPRWTWASGSPTLKYGKPSVPSHLSCLFHVYMSKVGCSGSGRPAPVEGQRKGVSHALQTLHLGLWLHLFNCLLIFFLEKPYFLCTNIIVTFHASMLIRFLSCCVGEKANAYQLVGGHFRVPQGPCRSLLIISKAEAFSI